MRVLDSGADGVFVSGIHTRSSGAGQQHCQPAGSSFRRRLRDGGGRVRRAFAPPHGLFLGGLDAPYAACCCFCRYRDLARVLLALVTMAGRIRRQAIRARLESVFVTVLAILLLTLTSCRAQSDQSKVEAVLKQMERAEQTGDFNTWVTLWTREKSGEFEKLRPYATARPDIRYRPLKTFVRGDEAVLLVQGGPNPYAIMTLVREGGQWKIQDESFRETAPDPISVYALLPPDPGAFARAGSPWDQIAPALRSEERRV